MSLKNIYTHSLIQFIQNKYIKLGIALHMSMAFFLFSSTGFAGSQLALSWNGLMFPRRENYLQVFPLKTNIMDLRLCILHRQYNQSKTLDLFT